jgi:hypothetical protein
MEGKCMNSLKQILILALLYCAANPALAGTEACDTWFTPAKKPTAVVVVTHGMNLKPARMDNLANALKEAGMEVLRPAFTGHCGPENESYLDVTAPQWEADARRIHALASAKAKALGVPIYLVAYSFTTTVFQSLSGELAFAKRVYLAPALATRFWYPLVVGAARIFPGLSYASMNLPEYQMHPRSGARPFVALDYFLKAFREGRGQEDAAPALWLVDPKDELISYEGLLRLSERHPGWKLETVSTEGSTLPKSFHHLIVDKASLGPAAWDALVAEILRFLRTS